MKLPVEIRVEIYIYAATSDDVPKKYRAESTVDSKKPSSSDYRGNLDGYMSDLDAYFGDLRNQEIIAQPGLFQACSQIYHESHVFFYRHHEFKFVIWQDNNNVTSHPNTEPYHALLAKVLRWLDNIGVDMQEQIRTVEFRLLRCGSANVTAYTRFIEAVHAKISDQATIIYRGSGTRRREEYALLSGLADVFGAQKSMRAPQIEHPELPVDHWDLRSHASSLTFWPGAG